MQVPIQIVLKGVPNPGTLRAMVRDAAADLERYYGRVTSCRVVVTNPNARHRKGGQYDVHVSLQLPTRKEVTVSRRATADLEREHLKVALRQAFAQARRQLQDEARKMRTEVKVRVAARRAR